MYYTFYHGMRMRDALITVAIVAGVMAAGLWGMAYYGR